MTGQQLQRREWMGVLARADEHRLASLMALASVPADYKVLRGPESGLIMVRGRIGGDGQPFNLGEMTVSRCTVILASGVTGHSMVGGRRHAHALNAALIDALLDEGTNSETILQHIIEPLAAAEAKSHSMAAAETAATKVDFFTLMRGDDA